MASTLRPNRLGANRKRALLVIFVVFSCIVADQSSKALAAALLDPQTTVYLAGRMIRFEYSENQGAFLSWGWQLPEEMRFWSFTVMTGLLLFGILAFVILRPQLSTPSAVALSGIAGGGISNVVDRLLHGGAVIDFIGLNTVIVNLADMIIAAGLAMTVISWLRFRDRQR